MLSSFDISDALVPESLRGEALEELLDAVRRYLARTSGELRVLEIGAAHGFSAMAMASLSDRMRVVTIELSADRSAVAETNIRNYRLSGRIELINADAAAVLPTFGDDCFDIAFLDGPKAQYSKHFAELRRVVVRGGLILIDNVNFNKNDKKYKTINRRMALFRDELLAVGALVDLESGFAEVCNDK